MASARHTPGPWVVTTCDEGDAEGWVEIQQDGAFHPCPDDICRVHRRGPAGGAHDDGLDDGDARLIAAAPDLLAALKALVCAVDGGEECIEDERLAACRAAIARAEGLAS